MHRGRLPREDAVAPRARGARRGARAPSSTPAARRCRPTPSVAFVGPDGIRSSHRFLRRRARGRLARLARAPRPIRRRARRRVEARVHRARGHRRARRRPGARSRLSGSSRDWRPRSSTSAGRPARSCSWSSRPSRTSQTRSKPSHPRPCRQTTARSSRSRRQRSSGTRFRRGTSCSSASAPWSSLCRTHQRVAREGRRPDPDPRQARAHAYGALSEQVRSLAEGQRELAPRRATSSRRCARRPCAGAGARCSSSGWSRWRGCSPTATSSSSRRCSRRRAGSAADLIVKLPGGRNSSSTRRRRSWPISRRPRQRTTPCASAKLADHARQIRDHVTKLSSKSYWGQFDPTPDFVVLFLPGEAVLQRRARHDPTLIEEGVAQR